MISDGGKTTKLPKDFFCLQCGVCCDSFPKKSREQVLKEYRNNPVERNIILTVHNSVKTILERFTAEFAQKSVFERQSCGVRLIVRCAFVTVEILAVVLKMPTSSVPTIKIISVRSPDGGDNLSGVVMRFCDLPRKLPHYEAELYSDSQIVMDDTFLKPEQILRHAQPDEEYHRRVENWIAEDRKVKLADVSR